MKKDVKEKNFSPPLWIDFQMYANGLTPNEIELRGNPHRLNHSTRSRLSFLQRNSSCVSPL
jgi:hypothetical protein